MPEIVVMDAGTGASLENILDRTGFFQTPWLQIDASDSSLLIENVACFLHEWVGNIPHSIHGCKDNVSTTTIQVLSQSGCWTVARISELVAGSRPTVFLATGCVLSMCFLFTANHITCRVMRNTIWAEGHNTTILLLRF